VTVALERPSRIGRGGALVRVLGAPLLGVVGPLALWPAAVAQVALPAMAALHLARRPAPEYLCDDGPRVADGLEWLLGLYAWAALVADRPPAGAGPRPVRLRVAIAGDPRPGRALARAVTGLPAAAALLVAGAAALIPWVVALACVLVAGRQPGALWRLQARLLVARAAPLARQASLVPGPARPGAAQGTPAAAA
jgi:hypothetical protein